MRANEAPLTGESQSVEKQTGTCAPDTPLADRTNMIFLGTSIVDGSGRALVVATGMDTEVGHIVELLHTAASDETPVQKRLDLVARRLLWACLGIVILVFVLGLLRGIAFFELFLGAVSLAVAAIPEGLPAVVTVALALGMQRMARRNALVRRLPAVETFGCAQVICSDKTGTLTVGEMTARKLVTNERIFGVTGEGYAIEGAFFVDGAKRAAAALGVALFGGFYFLRGHPGGKRSGVLNKTAWQRMSVPVELSRARAFLEHNCAACHTAVKSVEASNCIVCHASNESLLQRQPTAFHADVGSCIECHGEHQGADAHLVEMDHARLAKIGLVSLTNAAPCSEQKRGSTVLVTWLRLHQVLAATASHPQLTPREATLNCRTCHGTKDHHVGLFGGDCATCHGNAAWTIAAFRHPSPRSLDCAQCHQAPPSHYMEHFNMVSKRVAGQDNDAKSQCCDPVQVNQCYRCHQTTSWNDIKGVGWYKHH